MESGDPIEMAWWVYDGQSREAAEQVLVRAINLAFEEAGWVPSPIRYETLPADSQRLPAPPPEARGKNPYGLVAWAEAVAPDPKASVTADMDNEAVEKLRRIVRMRWADAHPGEKLSNEAADAVIDQLTPNVVRALVQ
jgi:hypothetical protein